MFRDIEKKIARRRHPATRRRRALGGPHGSSSYGSRRCGLYSYGPPLRRASSRSRLVFFNDSSAHADGERRGAGPDRKGWASETSRRGASSGALHISAGPRRSPSACTEILGVPLRRASRRSRSTSPTGPCPTSSPPTAPRTYRVYEVAASVVMAYTVVAFYI